MKNFQCLIHLHSKIKIDKTSISCQKLIKNEMNEYSNFKPNRDNYGYHKRI